MVQKLVEVSRLPLVLLGLAFILSAVAVGTPYWQGGNLFASKNLHWEQLCAAVGALLIIGCIGMGLAFFLGIYWTIYLDTVGPMLLAFYITLYVGATALSIAVLVFTTMITRTWSFFIAIMACFFAALVIWIDLPLLSVAPLPWKGRQVPANL